MKLKDTTLEIKPFDPKTASEAGFAAFHAFSKQIRAETYPDDEPRTLEETRQELLSIPDFVRLVAWGVWRGPELVAEAHVATWQIDSNRHLAEANIAVLPALRRQGIATELVPYLVKEAEAQGRRLLIGMTDSFAPAGEAFAARLGADAALAVRISKLETKDVDRGLMRRWRERAWERAAGFELDFWDGAYPESELEAMVAMKKVMNTAPREGLELEDIEWTAEQLREMEASLAAQGIRRWTLVARRQPSGEVAGYTDIYWNPRHPKRLNQGDTGVFPKYRNLGLGRWLKAVMMARILKDLPQVERIFTDNAQSNAPMLAINEAMGFRPYKTKTEWQVGVAELEARTGKAGAEGSKDRGQGPGVGSR